MKRLNIHKFAAEYNIAETQLNKFIRGYSFCPIKLIQRIDEKRIIIEFKYNYLLISVQNVNWFGSKYDFDYYFPTEIFFPTTPSYKAKIYLLTTKDLFFFKIKS
jgi:hypothetical protein